MPHGLHAHRSPLPDFLQVHTEQGLRTAGILILTLVLLAILFAGVSLIEETNSLLPRP